MGPLRRILAHVRRIGSWSQIQGQDQNRIVSGTALTTTLTLRLLDYLAFIKKKNHVQFYVYNMYDRGVRVFLFQKTYETYLFEYEYMYMQHVYVILVIYMYVVYMFISV